MDRALLRVEGLHKSFVGKRSLRGRPQRWVKAVDGVSLVLHRGETLAIVGESGAGKSTLGRLVLRLIESDSGQISFDGQDLRALSRRALRLQRAKMRMVFQDPYSAFDPRMPIGSSVGEPLLTYGTRPSSAERRTLTFDSFERVGMSVDYAHRYPYELSGGQLQRLAVARAIVTNPDIIVCDEPVAALDVSIRAQIINLLRELQVERNVGLLFISHDLPSVSAISDRIAVMYAGRIVETGPTWPVIDAPNHPYTRQLLAAIPQLDVRRRNLDR